MRYLSVILTLWLVASTALAQTNIRIFGTTVGAEGKEIELYKYTDPLSHQEELLSHDVIGEDQSFDLTAYANYPMLVFIQVENYSQSFFVEPGHTYELYIPRFDWDLDEKKNVFLSPEALPIEFVNVGADEINLQINRFDNLVDSFITANSHYFDLRFRPQRRYFDSLVALVGQEIEPSKSEFVERYKTYTLAELKYKLHFDTRKNLIKTYIANQPIRYYDENYMSMFEALYGNTISKGNRYVDVYTFSRWIDACQMDVMRDSLGLDPLLRNEQVRELAALIALKEAYSNSRYYNRDAVARMIGRLAATTKFKDHVRLANNLLATMKQMEKGSEVAGFELPNVDKQMVSLDQFAGKWVYLSFVKLGDPNSLGEVETLAHFKDSVYAHSSNVEFVTIVCDREFQKMYHFLKNTRHNEKYSWTWLHFNNNFKLLERYQVVSYPTFLLINPEGCLQFNITPSPASGFLVSPPWVEKKKDDPKPFFLGN